MGILGESPEELTAVHLPAEPSSSEYTTNRKGTTIFPAQLPPFVPSSLLQLPAALLAQPRRRCHVFVCARLETPESRDFLSTSKHTKGC